MQTDYSDTHRLGFLRVIQVLLAFNIMITLAVTVFWIKDSHAMEYSDILDYVNLVFNGIFFWLIWRRASITRAVIIGCCAFNIVSGSIYNMVTGTFNPIDQVILSIVDIVLITYFATSKRVRAQLVEPFTLESTRADGQREAEFYRPRTWGFWRNLIMYFCVFSVVGHWLEAGYCTFIRLGILPGIYDPNSQIWSDWLYPFPVYGFGAVACVLLLYPLKMLLQKHLRGTVVPLLISFVANGLVCTGIELVMGLMLNQPLPDGSLPLWDYRDMFCNFMGQVCLQNGVAFGLVATLMTWVIYPGLETLFSRLSSDAMNTLFVAVAVGFAVLVFLYFINVVAPGISSGGSTDIFMGLLD